MNGGKGIFRVSVDVYLYSCSELECPQVQPFVQKFQPLVGKPQ
jgi:hypothetical protein